MRNTAPESTSSTTHLDVVAAILRDADGRVLLSQRPAHKHQGGLWEFPGGKVEAGESLSAALAREMEEELGLRVSRCRPFMTVEHSYPDLCVRLHFREVTGWSGTPHGHEGQPFGWFAPHQLAALSFPEANRPVTTALQLPDRWLVLPPGHEQWREVFAGLKGKGVEGVYLRGAEERVLGDMVAVARSHGLLTLVRDDPALVAATGADGVHLSSARAQALRERPSARLVSMACHSPAELDHAARLQVDMAMLSPVHRTASHPSREPLGWESFSQLATGRPFAVYALGGVAADELEQARAHGARGLAGISAFWKKG